MPRVACFVVFALFLAPLGMVAVAHPGKLNDNSHHHDTSTGRYPCHRDPGPNRDATAVAKKSREHVCHGKSPNYSLE
jgi:hypothetical protein